MLNPLLGIAFFVAVIHPDVARYRTVAELASKGLYEIDRLCYMIDSKGVSYDLTSICNSTLLPQTSETERKSPIETKILQSGEKSTPKERR